MDQQDSTDHFSDIEKDMRGPESRLASTGKRFLNSLIDSILIYALTVAYGIYNALNSSYANDYMDEGTFYFLFIIIYFLYSSIFELTTGKTLGKLITKTHVVKEDGEKLDLKTAIGRSLCRIIPFDAFSFLGSNIGWHDSISKTRVINDEE